MPNLARATALALIVILGWARAVAAQEGAPPPAHGGAGVW